MKRYYEMLFPKELKENEYVCLFMTKTDNDGKEIKFHKYAKNFSQYLELISKYKYQYHMYNALATVKKDKNGELNRLEANMRQRRVLFIEFDKKDHPGYKNVQDFTKLIKNKFPDLFLHAYYDSGHGYHYYVIINPTCKNRKISDLNKEICSLVGADTNACKVTQIARIPCTYNMKYTDDSGRFPLVKEIDHYKKHPYQVKHFHPCNIDYIQKRIDNVKICLEFEAESKPLQKWDYGSEKYDIKYYPCLCTEKILHEGADEGQRNTWLGRIISMLFDQGYTESKIREICLEWNDKCRPPKNPNAVKAEINGYLDKRDIYRLNGCWEKIQDPRVKEIVQTQCDKMHCLQAIQKKPIYIEEDLGVKMSQKLLTKGKLSNHGKTSLSGYEYLVMTILYKYIKPKSRTPFTVKELKMKMQWKKSSKWQLCIDIKTFKETLERLVEHNCIELIEPEQDQGRQKKITYDDTIIKIKRGFKELNNRYIEFYYSAARAFISKQITKNEFKVFLCIVNNIKDGKSCTLEELDKILCIGKSHVAEAIKNLKIAQCIDVVQHRSDKGKWYNRYSLKHTDKYNDETVYDENLDIELDIPSRKIINLEKNNDIKDGITIKLLA